MQSSWRSYFPNIESPTRRLFLRALFLIATSLFALFCEKKLSAKDYVLTIGGGYEPAGNQASLEANVLFFQQVVSQQFPPTVEHQIFFADGFDAQEDLQVMSPKAEANSPTIALLESAFAIDRPLFNTVSKKWSLSNLRSSSLLRINPHDQREHRWGSGQKHSSAETLSVLNRNPRRIVLGYLIVGPLRVTILHLALD